MIKKENNPNTEGFTLPLPDVMVVITLQSPLFSNTWLRDTVVIVAGWDTIFSTIKYLYYKKVAFAMVLLELLRTAKLKTWKQYAITFSGN